ncbi:hypothetical protein D3260_16140 [Salinisphaera sp. Q1T1-3]|nr:hypothetical protein D3260_16140 [Salinisphaera sp. Q1T1-3]
MYRRLGWHLAGLMGLALAGCAGPVDTQTFIDPSVTTNQTKYDGFLAYAAFKDLAVEGRFEKAMCQQLVSTGHACTPMLTAASPTRPQDAASRQRAMAHSGAQAALVIELADPDTTSRQMLANGCPGYRVSLVDTRTQRVIARMAIDTAGRSTEALPAKAEAVARATVSALDRKGLLQPR